MAYDLLHISAPVANHCYAADAVKWWEKCLTSEMMVDINAPAIITGYFVSANVGFHCSIFAPLGYAPYQEIGEKMATDGCVLEAAKESGLLSSGVSAYISAALDNDGSWYAMKDGVAFLIADPDLRCFIPFRDRYIAERLLRLQDSIDTGRQTWSEAYRTIASDLSTEWAHGY